MYMSPYSILPLISALFFAVLGIYAFINDPKAAVNRSYGYWCFFTFFWQSSWTVLFNVQDPAVAKILVRIGYSGIAFLPAAYYHFIVNFLGIKRTEQKILGTFYAIGLVFVVLTWTTNLFVAGFYQHAWGYYPQAGIPGHPIFMVVVTVAILRGPWLILQRLKDPSANLMRRNQLGYVLVASLVYDLAATDCLVNYGFDFYPLGVIALLIANGLITYAVMKYRLMDITVFFRRVGLLMSVYALLLAGVVPLLFGLHRIIISRPQNSFDIFIGGFLILATVVSSGPFLYAYFVRHRLYFKEQTMEGLTHELKSPLATIENALTILTDRIKTKVDTGDVEYLTMIQKNQERLRKSVNELLHIYETSGQNSLTLSSIDVREVAKSVVGQHQSLADLKGLELGCDVLREPLLINADRQKIDQVLSNIVSNAVKFTDAGFVKITAARRNDSVEIAVHDSGAGIASAELPYVFARFYQGKKKHPWLWLGPRHRQSLGRSSWRKNLGGERRRGEGGDGDVYRAGVKCDSKIGRDPEAIRRYNRFII